jgi:hypothetical protein
VVGVITHVEKMQQTRLMHRLTVLVMLTIAARGTRQSASRRRPMRYGYAARAAHGG